MNDNEMSQLMKDMPAPSENLRNEQIATALNNFPATQRRSSRTLLWSVAAAALLVIGAGIGVSLQSLTDDGPVMYADGNIESLGAASTDVGDTGSINDDITKGVTAAGPCDSQFADATFVATVRLGTERVSVYAIPSTGEPIVRLVDPTTCDELAITRC